MVGTPTLHLHTENHNSVILNVAQFMTLMMSRNGAAYLHGEIQVVRC